MLLTVDDKLSLEVMDRTGEGGRVLDVRGEYPDPDLALLERGAVPLPPYIGGWVGESERYQTIYADHLGSVAAPTAGLHFTPDLLERLEECGVRWEVLTLHIGLGTFRPVKSQDVSAHTMHREMVDVPARIIDAVVQTRERGGRVIAVGTTTVRALESAMRFGGGEGWHVCTELFITPGFEFRAIDGLITNFHLPRSTLMMLVSGLVGRDRLLGAYHDAIEQRYRFYSFGDAMLII